MRLINVHTLELETFDGDAVPLYTILSHRWGDEEVSFAEMMQKTESVRRKPGFKKILLFCQLAAGRNHDYLWVDTCCIDSSSSAELSESINSMWRWYKEAREGYAYLHDVTEPSSLTQSAWFTRGWTLQELLATFPLGFYDRHGTCLGTKVELAETIGQRTGIPTQVLLYRSALFDTSISQRMSWAADRRTTRKEDIAYCLLGIFDVNLPLLYGEGEKAFIRLQQEIMRTSGDHTIFAWEGDDNDMLFYDGSLLAPHPRCFRRSHRMRPFYGDTPSSRLIELTNVGISFELFLYKDPLNYPFSRQFIGTFRCFEPGSDEAFAWVYLVADDSLHNRRLCRSSARLGRGPLRGEVTRIHVQSRSQEKASSHPPQSYCRRFRLRTTDRTPSWIVSHVLVIPIHGFKGEDFNFGPNLTPRLWHPVRDLEDDLKDLEFALPVMPQSITLALRFIGPIGGTAYFLLIGRNIHGCMGARFMEKQSQALSTEGWIPTHADFEKAEGLPQSVHISGLGYILTLSEPDRGHLSHDNAMMTTLHLSVTDDKDPDSPYEP